MSVPSDRRPLQTNMVYTDGENAVMVQQITRVNVEREMPRDHLIWSLICCIYYNPFLLGLVALIFSVKARDRKVAGDIEGARSHGSTAQTLNIISTVLFCLSFLVTLIVVCVLFPRRY
ncbi:dispanin subfamily A member 2b-like [Eucyclogobius newberryi]|uniref:dispanin subfamily A member 2b-like n=1 Tax=Eucyclogobius newberryi TaxID=166745 RepID=UPI003B5D05DB